LSRGLYLCYVPRPAHVTGPVLAALVFVVVVEAAVTHAILGSASALMRVLVAIAHAAVIVWLVVRFATKRA
jgi:hypothetical protein